MRTQVVGKNEGGQRLDRYLRKRFSHLPASTLHKWLREKRIKVNGARAKGDLRIEQGDTLDFFVRDEFFETPQEQSAFLRIDNPNLSIVYEDPNILLIDKPAGLICHSDDKESVNTLLSRMQAYLYIKGEYVPEITFAPALCNRIDRNTRGIVIAAKTADALRTMDEKIRSREVDKRYVCMVHGAPNPPSATLRGYLLRDMKLGRVTVYETPRPGAKYAETVYKTLERRNDVSIVECHLVTGRTHQIRAQMAHAGCPLVGDGKYGVLRGERSGQKLVSYSVTFNWQSDAGVLDYLKGRVFEIEHGL